MPGFHHSVAVLPLPFRRSVLPFRCAVLTFRCRPTVAVLPFRIPTVAVTGENGNAGSGNVFSVYIGMKKPERSLAVRLRQNDKNRIRSYCYGTAVTAQVRATAGDNGNGNGVTDFFT